MTRTIMFGNRRKSMTTTAESTAASQLDLEIARLHEHIPLKQAAAELPRRRAGKRTHVATLYRWSNVGLRGHKLRTIWIGASACTTRAWLAEFFDALTADRVGEPAPVIPATSAAGRKAFERAERKLDAVGIA
jgi:uncharacterized protein YqjF (DUF2071 family)